MSVVRGTLVRSNGASESSESKTRESDNVDHLVGTVFEPSILIWLAAYPLHGLLSPPMGSLNERLKKPIWVSK